MKALLLTTLIVFSKHIIAQRYYNEAHARQVREWANTERHYQHLADIGKTNYSYTSNYGSNNTSGSFDNCDNPLIQVFFKRAYKRCMAERKSSTTVNDQKEKNENDIIQKARNEAASEKYAAEQKRLAALREKRKQEEEAIKINKAIEWFNKAKDNNLLPCEEPPVFKDNCEEYYWYASRGLNGGGFFKTDPYSNLKALQLQWDGKGCMGQKNMDDMILKLKNAVHSSLKYCLSAEMMMSFSPNLAKTYIPDIFSSFYKATQLPDATLGHERAYKKLLQLYRQDTIYGETIPATLGQKAVVYAWAANNNDATALKDLLTILAKNVAQIHDFDTLQLKQVSAVLTILKKDDYALTCLNALGAKQLQYNTANAFNTYKKILDYPNAQTGLQNLMQSQLYSMAAKDEKLASQMSLQEYNNAFKITKAYVTELETAIANKYRIRSVDLRTLFSWYNGSLGEKPDIDKALKYVELLANEGEFEEIKKAIVALRTGKAGWPKNDEKAWQLAKVIDNKMPDKTTEEKEIKGTYLFETAGLFAANNQIGINQNNTIYDDLLNRAARAYAPFAYTYAKWLSDSKTPLRNKSIIMAKFWGNVYVKYLEDSFVDRYLETQIDPKILSEEIRSTKAWVELLK